MNIYGCVNVTADNFVMQQHMRCGMVPNAAADASRGNVPANSWKENDLGN